MSASGNDGDLTYTYDGLNRMLTGTNEPLTARPEVVVTNAFNAVGDRTTLTLDLGPTSASSSRPMATTARKE